MSDRISFLDRHNWNAPTDTFYTHGPFVRFTGWLVAVGVFFLFGFFALAAKPRPGKPSPVSGALTFMGLGAGLLGVTLLRNHYRVRWVQVSDGAGISWEYGGRTHAKPWDQLENVHFYQLTIVRGGNADHHFTITVSFKDGDSFAVTSREVIGLAEFAIYMENLAKRLEVERTVADRAEVRDRREARAKREEIDFGPLRVCEDGLKWDGGFCPWDRVRSYEVASGFLHIVAADGREFLRRLLELGDPNEVIARLDATIGRKRVVPLAR